MGSDDSEYRVKGEQRIRKLKRKKGRMIVNGAGLKKIILPLLGKKAKDGDHK